MPIVLDIQVNQSGSGASEQTPADSLPTPGGGGRPGGPAGGRSALGDDQKNSLVLLGSATKAIEALTSRMAFGGTATQAVAALGARMVRQGIERPDARPIGLATAAAESLGLIVPGSGASRPAVPPTYVVAPTSGKGGPSPSPAAAHASASHPTPAVPPVRVAPPPATITPVPPAAVAPPRRVPGAVAAAPTAAAGARTATAAVAGMGGSGGMGTAAAAVAGVGSSGVMGSATAAVAGLASNPVGLAFLAAAGTVGALGAAATGAVAGVKKLSDTAGAEAERLSRFSGHLAGQAAIGRAQMLMMDFDRARRLEGGLGSVQRDRQAWERAQHQTMTEIHAVLLELHQFVQPLSREARQAFRTLPELIRFYGGKLEKSAAAVEGSTVAAAEALRIKYPAVYNLLKGMGIALDTIAGRDEPPPMSLDDWMRKSGLGTVLEMVEEPHRFSIVPGDGGP